MAERFIPRAQEIYRHFKGELYQVMAVAEHTETGEQLVIYQALYGEFKIYARPLEMFVSPVDRKKYPDAEQEFRFQLQGPDAQRQCAASGGDGIASGEEETLRPVGVTVPDREASDQAARGAEDDREAADRAARGAEDGREAADRAARGAEDGREAADRAAQGAEDGRGSAVRPTDAVREESEPEEPGLDPLVLEFLDANTYEERLNVLAALHHRITNEMITTMSLCCDIEVDGDDVEQRYEELKQCLLMKERFEIKRLS